MSPTLPPDLLHVLTTTTDADIVRRLLYDILTPHELAAICERWEIVKRLEEGKSQRTIRDEIGVSVTTISRGNRQLKYGSGGFRDAIALLKRRDALALVKQGE
jgi:TrpR family trp operon transcriptional repressor